MNIRLVGNYTGNILRIEALFMIPALLIAVFCGETSSVIGFAATIAGVMLIGTLLVLIKPKEESFYAREGFSTVALSWILLSLFGSLPFFISGEIPNFVDALFETVSGFSTTGGSILKDVEALSKSMLYWRSFSHWIGGMGVLVLMLAVVPMRGKSGNNGNSFKMLRAETTGPVIGRLVPKVKRTAMILYSIYVVLTVIEIIFLICGGMPVFDSVVNSFATAGTGGFAIKNASIGAYDSYYLQTVISVFMLLFGINFNIFYLLLVKDFKSILKDGELKLYLGIIIASVVVIALNTMSTFNSVFDAFHHSFFQVSSIITTTGFSTVDFNTWPTLSKMILTFLMFTGACAGSTGGGIKMARILMVGKFFKSTIQKMIHPRGIKPVTVNGRNIDDGVVKEVMGYMSAYVIICGISILLVAIDGFDYETTVSSVIACINNIGPGFGLVGPTGNFADFSILSKLVLCADMLIGRLEIFPILLLFTPATWFRNK